MLEIAPDKVAHVIVKAREYDAKVGTWDDTARSGDAEDDPSSILEDYANDPTRAELAAFIDGLNVDEQVNLVALAWIGRGTFAPEELDEAVETARSERVSATSKYLMGIPLLADYLETTWRRGWRSSASQWRMRRRGCCRGASVDTPPHPRGPISLSLCARSGRISAQTRTLDVLNVPAAKALAAFALSNSQCHGSLLTVRTKPRTGAFLVSQS